MWRSVIRWKFPTGPYKYKFHKNQTKISILKIIHLPQKIMLIVNTPAMALWMLAIGESWEAYCLVWFTRMLANYNDSHKFDGFVDM